MCDILHMGVTSLVAVVAPRTGKIIKNGLGVFGRGENLVYYTLHLSYANRQKSCYKVRIYTDEKGHLKG